jgi:hypothetical protein
MLPLMLQVHAQAAAVAAAEAHLQGLLPSLAATAGVAVLEYVSIQNQGNYLVELPAARTTVPQGWEKARLWRSPATAMDLNMFSKYSISCCVPLRQVVCGWSWMSSAGLLYVVALYQGLNVQQTACWKLFNAAGVILMTSSDTVNCHPERPAAGSAAAHQSVTGRSVQCCFPVAL